MTVVGQIGGMPNVWPDLHPNFPWYEKQASFFVVDKKIASMFAEHAKHHGGNSSNCAFCQSLAAKNAHAVAVVNLVDENGEIIRLDARELLGLKENQTVVIRGKARLLERFDARDRCRWSIPFATEEVTTRMRLRIFPADKVF